MQDVDYTEENLAVQAEQTEVIEMDELFDYINEKKHSLRNNVGNKKSCDKSHTFIVEGVNSDIRKYIAALQRRSKCFFRSLKTFKAVLRVFVYAYNKLGQFKLAFPSLKSAVVLIQFLPSL